MKTLDFNGWSFRSHEQRKRMRYIVVMDGDLDINNALGFRNRTDLSKYLKDTDTETFAVFKVSDITWRMKFKDAP